LPKLAKPAEALIPAWFRWCISVSASTALAAAAQQPAYPVAGWGLAGCSAVCPSAAPLQGCLASPKFLWRGKQEDQCRDSK